jgi:mono/diheme cytochrome c family protein
VRKRLAKFCLPVALVLAFFLTGSYTLAEPKSKIMDEDARRADAQKILKEKIKPFVETYCVKCHGSRAKAGLNLQSALKNPNGESSTLHFEKAAANVKVHDMPPEDSSKKPSKEERRQFVEWINKIKYLAPRDPGPFVLRRLTKTEYANTLHDLYGVDRSIADALPEEVVGEGFLNSISPLQSELFLDVANQVIEEIIASKGKAPTTVQKRLFGTLPPKGADLSKEARRVARSITRDAYRRPASESELDVLTDVYDLGRKNDLDHTGSLSLMLKAVLVSPQFLFITPAGEAKPKEKIVLLDDYQLASRLSYLLWSAPPDAELSALADKGELHEKVILKAQVQRLLKDNRSRALFDGFGAQWLRVNELDGQVFDPKTFPQMTPDLRTAMMEEARLFFESLVRENQSVARFVDSDYTFLNEPLAKIYGISQPVPGPKMRRVKLEDPNRGGILGMPAILATTSFPNRTSPVRRGVWVLEQVLGERVPSPPPDIPELEEQKHKEIEGLTLRQRTELHQSEATCRNCHKVLDPIGFGLENFDAIGRWREKNDEGLDIDSAGKLPNGQDFTSPAELKTLLAQRERDLARNLTERLMAFALGRPLGGYDGIVIDRILANVAKEGYRTRSIISEVITSYLFTYRRIKG